MFRYEINKNIAVLITSCIIALVLLIAISFCANVASVYRNNKKSQHMGLYLKLLQNEKYAEIKSRMASGDEDERFWGIWSICNMRDVKAYDIIDLYINDTSVPVRLVIARSLSILPDDRAMTWAAVLKNDKDEKVRNEALKYIEDKRKDGN